MIKNIHTDDVERDEHTTLLSYLAEKSVLWVLIAGVIILLVAVKFFAPW